MDRTELLKPEKQLQFAINHPDLEVIAGSNLYGTSNETSDMDKRGFTISPPHYIFNLYNPDGKLYNFETHDTNNGVDINLHSFRKFLKYSLKCNNNFIELLFAPEDKIICSSKFGKTVINNRDRLISKKAYKPFRGFAKSEFLKIVGDKTRDLGKKRKEQIKDFGYAVKNAYHSIRIMYQGAELLRDGHITFPRPEKDLLLEIREGDLSLDDFRDLYHSTASDLDKAFEDSPLPEKPNYEFANSLIKESIAIAKERYAS